MNVKVALQYNYGYAWHVAGKLSVKGFIYGPDGILIRDADLAAFFAETTSEQHFRDKLQQANGLFAVVMQQGEQVYCATDPTRTFPLFYSLDQGMLRISDAAAQAAPGPLQLLPEAREEFLYTGYVTGKVTLLQGVNQLQAGAYLVVDDERLTEQFYHLYISDDDIKESFDKLALQLAGIFDRVGERLVRALNGRTAVLPLSGGYDSRLIAVWLKKLGYPKVICFTYGTPSSPDVRMSRKVAAQLGVPWHFIAYTPQLIGDFLHTPEFQNYFPFAANYTSALFTQDYFAVRHLVSQGLIPEDAVIVPGHTGDFIAGGHLAPGLTEDNVPDQLIRRHYVFKEGAKSIFLSRISLPQVPARPYEYFENWNLKERQAKFIINSNRIYEFWGKEHLVPLWDKELVQFFGRLPLEYKAGRMLFDHVVLRYFFEPFHVAFRKKKYPFLLRKMAGVRNRLHRTVFSDPVNFKLIARSFLKDRDMGISWNSTEVNINRIQTAWYMAWLEEQLKQ